MKEDVLEQITADYLQLRGYFTRVNVRFKPDASHAQYESRRHSVMSDLDVLGYNPSPDLDPADRVWAVSCKAWQQGFSPTTFLNIFTGRTKPGSAMSELTFKELLDPIWNEAFRSRVRDLTRQDEFTYVVAVTRLPQGCDPAERAAQWMAEPRIADGLQGARLRFVTLREMWMEIVDATTTTLAPSDLGRLAQLLKAAGVLT